MKISFSNFISNISQTSKISSDAEKILEAISNDERMEKNTYRLDLSIEPMFFRDNVAAKDIVKNIGSSFYLPDASDNENKLRLKKIYKIVKKNNIRK